MSLSIQSSIHAVAATGLDLEPFFPKKAADDDQKSFTTASKVAAPDPKPVPKLDERAQIELLALQGHSNLEIAATVGLPESVVELTLGDSTAISSTTSSSSALLALKGRLSVNA